jgi:hypothetical protein
MRRSFLTAFLLLAFAAPPRLTWAQSPNACGCYRDDKGACKCAKKSKCGCPEECEPVGCEEKRQKAADKEADAALKKIEAREKQRGAAAAKQAKASAKAKGSTKGKPAASAPVE